MSKFQSWGGVLVLFGFMIYGMYLIHGTMQANQESEVILALKNLEVCSLLAVQTDLQDIKRCTAFFIDYMPEKSKGFKQGDQFPFAPIQPAQITNAYKLLSKTRAMLKLEPLPPMTILSHGSLELPTKENNY